MLIGIVSTIVVLACAAAIVMAFEFEFLMGWVGLAFLAATPTQIVLALLWSTEFPKSIGGLNQPSKGIAFTLVSVLAGGAILTVAHATVGGGQGPTPMLIQYMILSVVVALWIIPIWQAWPFSLLSKNPIVVGTSALLGFYLIAYLLWIVFFNYDALSHAPFYSPNIAPSGLFDMWVAMVFAVTSGAVVVVHVLYDFWPIDKITRGAAQPVRGLIASAYVLALSAVIHLVFLRFLSMEPIDYMVRVPVSMIFGVFLTTNMMQNKLFTSLNQPTRGFALTAVTVVCAVFMYFLYAIGSNVLVSEDLLPGPENGWGLELWIATSMLGVTFPIIIALSEFFKLWPFVQGRND